MEPHRRTTSYESVGPPVYASEYHSHHDDHHDDGWLWWMAVIALILAIIAIIVAAIAYYSRPSSTAVSKKWIITTNSNTSSATSSFIADANSAYVYTATGNTSPLSISAPANPTGKLALIDNTANSGTITLQPGTSGITIVSPVSSTTGTKISGGKSVYLLWTTATTVQMLSSI